MEKMITARQKIPGKRRSLFPGIFGFPWEINDMESWSACCLQNRKAGGSP